MVGPSAYGSDDFVNASSLLPYTIDFENSATATASAGQIEVTQQLDPGLDWSTFQLGAIELGNLDIAIPAGLTSINETLDERSTLGIYVQVVAGLNANTGVVTWTLTALAPTTMQIPEDPLLGLLPPDLLPPEGDGSVSYTVQPKAADTTGTIINAQASIVFDVNAAIPTAQIFDTLDAGPVSSTVGPLPADETSPSFTVNWSGQDVTGGSGIADYNVYVSDNGGAWSLWQADATQTSATYSGQYGHTYAFYSIATDNVGNVQATPAAAQATTLIQSPTSTVITTDNPTSSTYGQAVTFTATVSGADGAGAPTGTVQFVIDSSDFGPPVTLSGGAASLVVSTLTAGTHQINAIYTSDNPATFQDSQTTASLPQVVDAASLTITADNQTMVYGGTLPTLTASYSGFVNGDTSASLTTLPTLTTAPATSPVGGYPIDVSGAVDPNYDISYVTGTLTIGLATLTWSGVSNGNWTDAEWSGSGLQYPDNMANAIVDTPYVVQVTAGQAANGLAVSSGGEVAVGPGAVLAVTTDTSVTGGGTLNVDPNGAFITGGTLTLDAAGSLTCGPITAATYQLDDGTASANLAGPGGLTKDTTGTVILSGSNSYAGGTTVLAGTLIVSSSASLPAGSSLTIGAGGTFIFGPNQATAGPAAGAVVSAAGIAAAPDASTPTIAAGAIDNTTVAASAISTLSPALSAVPGNPPATPQGTASAATTTVYDTVQQMSAVAAPSSTLSGSGATARVASASVATNASSMATPAAMSSVRVDAVFTSYRSAFDQTVPPADIAQSARPWAWLAAIESFWNSSDQDKTTDSGVAALNKVLARFGV